MTSNIHPSMRMLHDRPVLVEVEEITRLPASLLLAQVNTAIGRTAVRWCGDPAAEVGEYHAEWTVDEDICWGWNAKPVVGARPEIRSVGHCVVLQGRLILAEDGAGMLDLDGTVILLDLADPLPDGVGGTWVELCVERENIALYPYKL
ncbi:hypothetical protein ACFWA9_04445 [Kitasatospora sp. NPDC059973]|uniref:hypothetical protein n=1 Tax=Kitasatospora sp. NPDC059973 TaxID=3347020 RepID=UPI00367610BA